MELEYQSRVLTHIHLICSSPCSATLTGYQFFLLLNKRHNWSFFARSARVRVSVLLAGPHPGRVVGAHQHLLQSHSRGGALRLRAARRSQTQGVHFGEEAEAGWLSVYWLRDMLSGRYTFNWHSNLLLTGPRQAGWGMCFLQPLHFQQTQWLTPYRKGGADCSKPIEYSLSKLA